MAYDTENYFAMTEKTIISVLNSVIILEYLKLYEEETSGESFVLETVNMFH